jgi:general secretion pathway protein J
MPASAARSGLQLFSIYLQSDNNSSFINVMLTPFFPLAEGALWHKEEEILMNHVSDFTLAYFGSEDGMSPDSWRDEWLSKDSLPRLVKINIQAENGAVFPEMIIELKIDSKTTANNNNNSPETENNNNVRSD